MCKVSSVLFVLIFLNHVFEDIFCLNLAGIFLYARL